MWVPPVCHSTERARLEYASSLSRVAREVPPGGGKRRSTGPLVPPVGGTKLYAFIERWRKKWYFLHFWRIWMFTLRIWTHALVSLSYFTDPTCICTPLVQIIVNCIHECVGGSTSYHLNNIYMVTQVKLKGRPSYTTVESMLTCKFTLLWMEV